MPAPEDPQELELVRKAITLGPMVRGCLEWDDDEARRLRDWPPIPDLDPDDVTNLLVEFVNGGGAIVQKKESRPGWRDRRSYWYKAKIPFVGLLKGLFVEFWLRDDDPQYPTVEGLTGLAHMVY